MAVISKRKKASKVVAKKEEVIKEVETEIPGKTFLHPSTLLSLETKIREVENCKLTVASEQQYLSNLILQMENLGFKIEKQKQKVAESNAAYIQSQAILGKLKEGLWDEYGIPKGSHFSYNPETGELQ